MVVLILLCSDLCKRGLCLWPYVSQRVRILVGVKGCAQTISTFPSCPPSRGRQFRNGLDHFQITAVVYTSLDPRGGYGEAVYGIKNRAQMPSLDYPCGCAQGNFMVNERESGLVYNKTGKLQPGFTLLHLGMNCESVLLSHSQGRHIDVGG